ncbi:phosphotransferase family protein [Arthrobacter sp. VKM Ac-2550]|uniref:phosphotransferase family protein n=1 Tax=Crystallibacter permensis TaxID=1938888 RepID=UPI00222604B4|nr:aminoglycoside phosphotransferase family protein [Arthrobacter sp. VKM Ac-2550]MCW2132171.1 Phosphotransferase enzyme family protein [Arthrobacter sp. VKM Ac-2550]
MPGSVVDRALPALDVVMDPERLSSLFGRPVAAAHLRYKPGMSVVARLSGSDGPTWIAGYSRSQDSKLAKTFKRAEQQGVQLESLELPEAPGHLVVSGPLALDAKLHRVLARTGLLSGRAGGIDVLNYNPHRRLVAAFGQGDQRRVAKVTAGRARVHAEMLVRLQDAGVPVLEQQSPGDEAGAHPDGADARHAVYYPWFGDTDLQRLHRQEPGTPEQDALEQGAPERGGPDALALAAEAGRTLALLHAQPPWAGRDPAQPATAGQGGTGTGTASKVPAPGHVAMPGLQKLAANTGQLVPAAAERLHHAADLLTVRLRGPGRAGFVHGDFSADQILVGSEGLRIIDLDRFGYGAVVSDLGCFAAVELLDTGTGTLTAALLEGYQEGQGAMSGVGLDADELNVWTACHLFSRILEPFRSCERDWRQRILDRLAQIEGMLA